MASFLDMLYDELKSQGLPIESVVLDFPRNKMPQIIMQFYDRLTEQQVNDLPDYWIGWKTQLRYNIRKEQTMQLHTQYRTYEL